MTTFEDFIEKYYPGMNYLAISTEQYAPAVVLNQEDRIVASLARVFGNMPQASWATAKVQTRIAGDKVQGTRALDAGAKLLGVFSVKAGVNTDYSVTFSFENATSMIFDTQKGGVYEKDVRDMIMKLKDTDKGSWNDLLHEFVVMESIYVESFKAKFIRNGKVTGAVDVEKLKDELSISGDYSWNSQGEVEIINNNTPLGVRGFLVKRFM